MPLFGGGDEWTRELRAAEDGEAKECKCMPGIMLLLPPPYSGGVRCRLADGRRTNRRGNSPVWPALTQVWSF